MEDVQFLFDNQLISEVENLIKNSKNKLLLISPFIDLDRRIQTALNEKIEKHDFELKILFGKNEDNYYKSVKKDSLDFLKTFPNVEIRYSESLHAKFYQNDYNYIMTSLNLYNFSLANNIEVGILGSHASKGIIGKALDSTDILISKGTDKIRQDVLGMGKDINPIEKFESIFKNAILKYKTEPKIIEKGGISGVFGGKKLDGYTVVIDELTIKNTQVPKIEITYNSTSKTLSASQLSKSMGVPQFEIINLMKKHGLVLNENITEKGFSKGLTLKSYMGKDYISYPENLEEFNDFN